MDNAYDPVYASWSVDDLETGTEDDSTTVTRVWTRQICRVDVNRIRARCTLW